MGELEGADSPTLAQVLDGLTAVAIGLTPRGTVSAWNRAAARTLGLPTAEALMQPLDRLNLPFLDDQVVPRLLSAAHASEPIRIEEVAFSRPDGSEGLLGLTASPVGDASSGGRSVLVLGRDVSQHRLRETRRTQQAKLDAIGKLAAGLAHELNTPTQYVSYNLSFLNESFVHLLRVVRPLLELAMHSEGRGISAEMAGMLFGLLRDINGVYLAEEVPRAVAQAIQGTERIAAIVRAMQDVQTHDGG